MKSYRELVNILESLSEEHPQDEQSPIDDLEYDLRKWAGNLEQELLEYAQRDLKQNLANFDGDEEKLVAALDAIQEKWNGTTVAILCSAIRNAIGDY